ncbi:MAG: hypothetical protein QME49_05710 [bacterium]|nr:hypothetical protein [bacterium]
MMELKLVTPPESGGMTIPGIEAPPGYVSKPMVITDAEKSAGVIGVA